MPDIPGYQTLKSNVKKIAMREALGKTGMPELFFLIINS